VLTQVKLNVVSFEKSEIQREIFRLGRILPNIVTHFIAVNAGVPKYKDLGERFSETRQGLPVHQTLPTARCRFSKIF